MNLSRSGHIVTVKFTKYDHHFLSPKSLASSQVRSRRRTAGDPVPVHSQPDIPRGEPDISAVVLEFGEPDIAAHPIGKIRDLVLLRAVSPGCQEQCTSSLPDAMFAAEFMNRSRKGISNYKL